MPPLEQLVTWAIVVGVGIGSLIGGIGIVIIGFSPLVRRIAGQAANLIPERVKNDPEAAAALASASKQTAEQWFAEFGKNELDNLKVRNTEADERYKALSERFDMLEAENARRAAEDQKRIAELENRVTELSGEVRVLTSERDNIARERDGALRKVEAQEKEIDHLKKEQQRDSNRIHELELEVAGLKARDTLMQDLKSLLMQNLVRPNSADAPQPSPAPMPPPGHDMMDAAEKG